MRIEHIDKDNAQIIIVWDADTEYPQPFLHELPEVLMEPHSLTDEQIKAELEKLRPEPVVGRGLEIPAETLSYLERNLEAPAFPEPADFTLAETDKLVAEYPNLGKAILEMLGVWNASPKL